MQSANKRNKSMFDDGWKSQRENHGDYKKKKRKDAECFVMTAYTIGPQCEGGRNRKARGTGREKKAICHAAPRTSSCGAKVKRRARVREEFSRFLRTDGSGLIWLS